MSILQHNNLYINILHTSTFVDKNICDIILFTELNNSDGLKMQFLKPTHNN